MVVLVTCNMKKIQSKLKALEWSQHYILIFQMLNFFKNASARLVQTFLPLLVYGDFSRCSRASNSTVQGRIWTKFYLIQAFMLVIVRMKKIQSIKKALGDHNIIHGYSRRSMEAIAPSQW